MGGKGKNKAAATKKAEPVKAPQANNKNTTNNNSNNNSKGQQPEAVTSKKHQQQPPAAATDRVAGADQQTQALDMVDDATSMPPPPPNSKSIIDMNLTKQEQEQTKSGMINDLVSMLKLMEEAPPDSVEEFLKYLHNQVQQAVIAEDDGQDDDAEEDGGEGKIGVDRNSRGLPKQKLADSAVLPTTLPSYLPQTTLEQFHARHAEDRQEGGGSAAGRTTTTAGGEGGKVGQDQITLQQMQQKHLDDELLFNMLAGPHTGGNPRPNSLGDAANAPLPKETLAEFERKWGHFVPPQFLEGFPDAATDAAAAKIGAAGAKTKKKGVVVDLSEGSPVAEDDEDYECDTADLEGHIIDSSVSDGGDDLDTNNKNHGNKNPMLANDPRQMLVDALFNSELFGEKDPFLFMPPSMDGKGGMPPPSAAVAGGGTKVAPGGVADPLLDLGAGGGPGSLDGKLGSGLLPFPTDLKGLDAALGSGAAGGEPAPPNQVSFEFLEDDLRDINAIICKMAPLSPDVMEYLSEFWQLNLQGVDHLMMRTNVAERIRCLSVLYLLTVGRQYGAIPQNTFDDLLDSLSLCLWQGAALLGPKTQQHVATLFDLDENATHEQICITITALGMTSFFSPLSLPMLERIHKELGLAPFNTSAKEWGTRHEQIAHLICQYFYPQLSSRPHMKLNCTVQLKVHENGPGRYTCTVDNARMLCIGLRQLYTSNMFSCSKVKFRAQLGVNDQKLSFQVVHHNEKNPMRVVLNVKTTGADKAGGKGGKANPKSPLTQEPLVAKKGQTKQQQQQQQQQDAAGAQFNANGVQATPTTNGGFSLLMEQDAPHDTAIGFLDMLTLEDVFSNPKSSPTGLRLYSDDDRVTFQFNIELEHLEPNSVPATAIAEEKSTTTTGGKKSPATQQQPQGKKKQQQNSKQQAAADTVPADSEGVTVGELVEAEEQKQQQKAATKNNNNSNNNNNNNTMTVAQQKAAVAEQQLSAKKQKEQEKLLRKFQQLEATETVARDTVVRNATSAWSQIQDEKSKDKKKLQQKKKEHDKKQEQKRDELQGECNTLQSAVQTLKNQCNKLNGEKGNLTKELSKLDNSLDSKQATLEALRAKFEQNKAILEKQDEEIEEVEAKAEERAAEADRIQELIEERERLRAERKKAEEERRARREARKMRQAEAVAAAFKVESSNNSTATPTAIQDFRSFWASNSDDPVFSPPLGSAAASSSATPLTAPTAAGGGLGDPFTVTSSSPSSTGGAGFFPGGRGGGVGGDRSRGGDYNEGGIGSGLSAQSQPFYPGYGGDRGGGGGGGGHHNAHHRNHHRSGGGGGAGGPPGYGPPPSDFDGPSTHHSGGYDRGGGGGHYGGGGHHGGGGGYHGGGGRGYRGGGYRGGRCGGGRGGGDYNYNNHHHGSNNYHHGGGGGGQGPAAAQGPPPPPPPAEGSAPPPPPPGGWNKTF